MSLRLPTRTLLPVLLLAVLGGIAATFIVARPPSAADNTPSLVRPKLAKPAPVKKPVKRPAPAKVRKAKPVTKAPVVKPAAKPKPAPVPVAPAPLAKAAPAPVDDGGLPKVLSAALADHRVVVVGLYDPEAAVDEIALAEARAGAAAAGAGFVALNVFAEAQSRPLLELLGTLENPSVLVYRRPDALFARIGGFADRETVAQAAANARR
jgi:pyruvate dehydrogenase E2 component (dihydrolipoamide acetyltransferase)